MPSKNCGTRSGFSSSGKNNGLFTSSCKSDDCCDGCADGAGGCCQEYAKFPQVQEHHLTLCGDCYKVPFYAVSSTLYEAVARHRASVGAVSPIKDIVLASAPATGVSTAGISTTTFFPTTAYYGVGNTVTSSAYPATLTASTAANVPAANVNVDSLLEINVPVGASDQAVIDLGELSLFAKAIYANQKSATRLATVPGSGGRSVVADTLLVTGATSGAPSSFPGVIRNEEFLHAPRVVINNRNHNYRVFVADKKGGCAHGKAFNGVDDQTIVYSNEVVTFEYNPLKEQWRVITTNSRA